MGAEVRPATERANWALGRAVAASFQIERCEVDFDALVVEHQARARLSWDGDRRAEVGDLAAGLAKQPSRVARRLESTRHGCELLIERWARLGEAAESETGWGEVEVSAALDLMGVAAELRQGRTPASPAPGSDPVAYRWRAGPPPDRPAREAEARVARRARQPGPPPGRGRGAPAPDQARPAPPPLRARRLAALSHLDAGRPGPRAEFDDEEAPPTVRVAVEPEPEPEPPQGPTRVPSTPEEINAFLGAIRERARDAKTEAERRASRMEIDAAYALFGKEPADGRPAPAVEAAGPQPTRPTGPGGPFASGLSGRAEPGRLLVIPLS